jgi:hypothetical protein
MDEGLFIDYVDVEWSLGLNLMVIQFSSPNARDETYSGDERRSIFG